MTNVGSGSIIILCVLSILLVLDVAYLRRRSNQQNISIPLTIPLLMLVLFGCAGIFCLGMAVRLFVWVPTNQFGSVQTWLLLGLFLLTAAISCGLYDALQRTREHIQNEPLLLPLLSDAELAAIRARGLQARSEPLRLSVMPLESRPARLIDNPRLTQQRLFTPITAIAAGVAGLVIVVVIVSLRFLPSAPFQARGSVIAATRATPTPTVIGTLSVVSSLTNTDGVHELNEETQTVGTDSSLDETNMSTDNAEAPERIVTMHTAVQGSNSQNGASTHQLSTDSSPTVDRPDDNNQSSHVPNAATNANPIQQSHETENTAPDTSGLENIYMSIFREGGAQIHTAPLPESEIFATIPRGIRLMAIGRTADSRWVRVRMAVDTGAWVAVEQLNDGTADFIQRLNALPILQPQ